MGCKRRYANNDAIAPRLRLNQLSDEFADVDVATTSTGSGGLLFPSDARTSIESVSRMTISCEFNALRHCRPVFQAWNFEAFHRGLTV